MLINAHKYAHSGVQSPKRLAPLVSRGIRVGGHNNFIHSTAQPCSKRTSKSTLMSYMKKPDSSRENVNERTRQSEASAKNATPHLSKRREQGLASGLYLGCLNTLKFICQSLSPVAANEARLGVDIKALKEQLARLFLWGEGLGDGSLEKALGQSDELKKIVLTLLRDIAQELLTDELLPALPASKKPSLKQLKSDIEPLLDIARDVIHSFSLQGQDGGDQTGDDASIISSISLSDIEQEDEQRQILSYRLVPLVDGLLDLSPTIENNLTHMPHSIPRAQNDVNASSISTSAPPHMTSIRNTVLKAASRMAEPFEAREDFQDAINKMSSEKVETRNLGLKALTSLIKEDGKKPKRSQLSSLGVHRVIEAIFRGVRHEAAHYARSAKSAAVKAESRLAACASLLRLVVEVNQRKMSIETVTAIHEHVCQSLPTADGKYCFPLVFDYVRALSHLLQYKAHVENLSYEESGAIVTFCLDLLQDINRSRAERNESSSTSEPLGGQRSLSIRPGQSASSSFNSGSGKTVSSSDVQHLAFPQLQSSAAGVTTCLQHIMSVPSSHLLEHAERALNILFDLLSQYPSNSAIQQPAFEVISLVIPQLLVSNISLASRSMKAYVSLMRSCWHTRASGLREVMLSVLIRAECLVPILITTDETGACKEEFIALLEVLRQEYCQRRLKDCLLIDDLTFLSHAVPVDADSYSAFKLADIFMGAERAEEPWALLRSIATILMSLNRAASAEADNLLKATRDRRHDSQEEYQKKRRRVESPLNETLLLLKSSQVAPKMYTLQILAFVLERQPFPARDLHDVLNLLTPLLSDEDGMVVSWTAFAISCGSTQLSAHSDSLKDVWQRIWRLASRHITSPGTCRASCHLLAILLDLQIVNYRDVEDLVDGMLAAVELNGPIECDEAATNFWLVILRFKAQENVGSTNEISSVMLSWLFKRWDIGETSRRSDAYRYNSIASIIQLLSNCLGVTFSTPKIRAPYKLGCILQARIEALHDDQLIKYLALDQDAIELSKARTTNPVPEALNPSFARSTSSQLVTKVFDFLASEASLLHRSLFSNSDSAVNALTTNSIYAATAFCIVGYATLSIHTLGHSNSGTSLRRALDQLRVSIEKCINDHDRRYDLIEGLINCFAEVSFPINEVTPSKNILLSGAIAMSQNLGSDFWTQIATPRKVASVDNDADLMDLDLDFLSQSQHERQKDTTLDLIHNASVAEVSPESFRACTSARICFMSLLSHRDDVDEEVCISTANAAFVEYLTSLRRQDFLLCRPVLHELLQSKYTITEDDADTILQYLSQTYTQRYETKNSEVAVGVCLDTLTDLVQMWTYQGSECAGAGAELYGWFETSVRQAPPVSSHVYLCAANLFQAMVKVCPDYAKNLSLPSVRTRLFEVLQKGNLKVKFEIGKKIQSIFGLFVLKEHEHVLEDVIGSLPNDLDWTEGIAIRLLILARLASSWSTLLRRCIYAIFETPAEVPNSTPHARRCLKFVASSLSLARCQELFKLFASQIIYTWLETQPLERMPFTIFGYQDLGQMLRDVQDEICGQLVMREKDDEAEQLARIVGLPLTALLESSFSKVAAYSIARDIALTPASSPSKGSGVDAKIRRMLGKEKYAELINQNFADIISLFFTNMDFEENIERAFQKRPSLSFASLAYQEMRNNSFSDKLLPPNQQPSFRARYLIDEIEYLCHRSTFDSDRIWTAPLFVYVLRKILDMIHPAFGSLHACSIVRKIRILICMAGATPKSDYPLEMTLNALRPFIIDAQCADDAIGIMQYIIHQGSAYLAEVPSFLTGNAASILVSMRTFFESTQDSTTQASQFRATIGKAQAFHGWLASFLSQYTSENMSLEAAESFRRIAKAAGNFSNRSNARLDTHESDMLFEMLEDERSGRNLLSSSTRDGILRTLCNSFEPPPEPHDDILGQDDLASKYAPVVWRSCRQAIGNKNYLLWSGSVLGRAYASRGHIDGITTDEANSLSDNWLPDQSRTLENPSRVNILRLICDLLQSDDQKEVGTAEAALRLIVTSGHKTETFEICEHVMPSSLLKAVFWSDLFLPVPTFGSDAFSRIKSERQKSNIEVENCCLEWMHWLFAEFAEVVSKDPVLHALPLLLHQVERLAEVIFPYVLHLLLLERQNKHLASQKSVSSKYRGHFDDFEKDKHNFSLTKVLLDAVLYLHAQPFPNEMTKADRVQWLDIDYRQAAKVASDCSMYKTALLFLELDASQSLKVGAHSTKVTSSRKQNEEDPFVTDVLLEIFRNLDEQDAFYGIRQPSSIFLMMEQLEHEQVGFKTLSFRGAFYDSQIRQNPSGMLADSDSMVRILNTLDLNGLSQSLLAQTTSAGPKSTDAALEIARKLEKWDISAPSAHTSSTAANFRTFQGLNLAADPARILEVIQNGLSELMQPIVSGSVTNQVIIPLLAGLAVHTEAIEIFSSRGCDNLEKTLVKLSARETWMQRERFTRMNTILSNRETALSSLRKRPLLRDALRISLNEALAFEVETLLRSVSMSRDHGALQNALTTATYLNQLIKPCQDLGVDISAAVQFESAQVLWSQGELTASIKILQDLQRDRHLETGMIHVSKATLLAKLGHRIAEARLEKPDEIVQSYLLPAISALGKASGGAEVSEVFHEFAFFCDQQLQNPDTFEDFQRMKRLRERKQSEVQDLENMIEKAPSQGKERDNLRGYRNKAKAWFDLDDEEYQRLLKSRQTFLKQSLENYLLSLQASDRYDNDTLRFSALWLENHESEIANDAVKEHITKVGSSKFAPLMNQWTSRLLDKTSQFHDLLFSLVFRICIEHPYHGMHQIFFSSKSKGSKDETALARYAAANKIVEKLKATKHATNTWLALHNTSVSFVRFASERLEDAQGKQGSRVPLRKVPNGQRVEQDINKYRIPPPTMNIALRADCDYSSVPFIKRFQPDFTVASGISAPKIVTAIGTDGQKYKQLFKGGNDDLRQDAIMEQVFAAVSSLLAAQRSTRQRALKIRMYKVLPLTATAGIIEFVPNTIPLHDYLLPAHQRHYPKDLKPNVCRKHISDVQKSPVETRIKIFRRVTAQFHPVLRYFFFERFESPDRWYDTRLAYTRSTAAISILGHVLGLGDRHGHNILLDETTGEVVHIDLGIAFEQGRILPVPEVVPFRLTRDLVDAMGITGTEGVFQRCCEFTLEALRNESYSIMTILDVLRYDPLYSWSLSPLRVKKLQEQAADEGPDVAGPGHEGKEKRPDDPGEADRALTVVKKKLSKSLSVQATVNELIQVATDERNLAVLFCGWAAYA